MPRPRRGSPEVPGPRGAPGAACPWKWPEADTPVTHERESWLGPALSSAGTAARSTRCGSALSETAQVCSSRELLTPLQLVLLSSEVPGAQHSALLGTQN